MHTKRDLSLNISAGELRAAKARWLTEVRAADAQRMTTSPAIIGQPHWDYINFGRLEPVLLEFEIDPSRCRGYSKLVQERVIAPTGGLALDSDNRRWRLQYLNPDLMMAFMPYMTDRIRLLLEAAQWRELPKIWSRTKIGDLPEGTLFVDYGGYRFKSDTAVEAGPGQVRSARRQANGILIAGIIDAFDAISTSAHNLHLSGSHRSTALGFIRGKEREGTRLRVDVTFLAFGTGFGPWSIPNAFVEEKLAQRDAEVKKEVVF